MDQFAARFAFEAGGDFRPGHCLSDSFKRSAPDLGEHVASLSREQAGLYECKAKYVFYLLLSNYELKLTECGPRKLQT